MPFLGSTDDGLGSCRCCTLSVLHRAADPSDAVIRNSWLALFLSLEGHSFGSRLLFHTSSIGFPMRASACTGRTAAQR